MKNLILNNPLNGEFKPVKDNDGTTSGLSLAHNKVKAENLEVRNLSGSIYFDEELTIASSGDINLDTDGGQVYIKDGGTDHFYLIVMVQDLEFMMMMMIQTIAL